MTPEDVAADAVLRRRFQVEVAYADRMQPSEDTANDDAELLDSADGTLIAAWLWPDKLYDRDPFEIVDRWTQGVGSVDQTQLEGADSVRRAWTDAIDRRRQILRKISAERFDRIIAATARAADRTTDQVRTHLLWTVPLTADEFVRLLQADSPFSFRTIVGISKALQLDFDRVGWNLVDPPHLAERIDQSLAATEIVARLRGLAEDDLKAVRSKLPRAAEVGRAPTTDAYQAPTRRYRGLYESLVLNESDRPEYTLEAIDEILEGAGEKGLPSSARERSWWAGNGAKAEGRPQVSAWWAAGYRIGSLQPDRGPVSVVTFEALPGRSEWLADPDRLDADAYRAPSPPSVPIYPIDQQGFKSLSAGLLLVAEAAKLAARQVGLTHADEATTKTPDDPDVRALVSFLEEVGESARAGIVEHFARLRGEHVDEAWMANLLTKARRQGWITNLGSRSQPRWTLSSLCPSCGARTLQPCADRRAKCATCGAMPSAGLSEKR